MRLLLSGGGTAGHVYPALSVVSELEGLSAVEARSPGLFDSTPSSGPSQPLALLWVGSEGGMETGLIAHAGLPFEAIPAGGLRGKDWRTRVQNVKLLLQGYVKAEGILRRFKPDVVFATGGYVGVPVVMAARRQGIPSLVYLPDIEPGWAVKALSRLVNRICVTSAESKQYLPGEKVIETGYPVRPELNLPADKAAARDALGLMPRQTTLLIFGGSRGAQRINKAALDMAEKLAMLAQVVHITGEVDAQMAQERVQNMLGTVRHRYHVYPYLHEMAHALRAADLVVSRAGASVLGEFPAAGLPAILVPLPIAGGHQKPNAKFLADAGGAVVVPNEELDGERLLREVSAALGDPMRLAEQSAAMRRLARPEAARRISEELRRLAA